jgi:hypothetical protein
MNTVANESDSMTKLEPKVGRLRRKTSKKAKSVKKTVKKARGNATDRTNKKAEIIAMLGRSKGATLPEIMEAAGWQAHTVRGFVSILGSKGGEKIESTKSSAGDRTYRIAK